MKKPSKRKLKDTLFDCSKLTGEVADTRSDETIALAVVESCREIIGTLKKIGPKAREIAIRRIAKLSEAVVPSVNCAVFRKHRDIARDAELPLI